MGDTPQGSRVGSKFGHYILRSLLGRGGMSEVYEAEDTEMGRTVALKLLPESLSNDPVFRKRLKREAHAAGQLHEPHVVPIHACGEIDGRLYVDMRLIDGTNLRTVVGRIGPLDPARAVAIVRQIASALDAAHAAGVTHRDVKPENILIAHDDFACLVDFGIANAATDEKLTQLGTAVGTHAYMAPERFTSDDVTYRADIYSLACVLYECLTGLQPYEADGLENLITAHLYEPIPRPSEMNPGVPAAFDGVIARGMAKQPGDRFASAGDLALAAQQALTANQRERATDILHRNRAATVGDAAAFRPAPPPAGGPTEPVSGPTVRWASGGQWTDHAEPVRQWTDAGRAGQWRCRSRQRTDAGRAGERTAPFTTAWRGVRRSGSAGARSLLPAGGSVGPDTAGIGTTSGTGTQEAQAVADRGRAGRGCGYRRGRGVGGNQPGRSGLVVVINDDHEHDIRYDFDEFGDIDDRAVRVDRHTDQHSGIVGIDGTAVGGRSEIDRPRRGRLRPELVPSGAPCVAQCSGHHRLLEQPRPRWPFGRDLRVVCGPQRAGNGLSQSGPRLCHLGLPSRWRGWGAQLAPQRRPEHGPGHDRVRHVQGHPLGGLDQRRPAIALDRAGGQPQRSLHVVDETHQPLSSLAVRDKRFGRSAFGILTGFLQPFSGAPGIDAATRNALSASMFGMLSCPRSELPEFVNAFWRQ